MKLPSRTLFCLPLVKPVVLVLAALAAIATFTALRQTKTMDSVQDALEASGMHCTVLHQETNPILVVSSTTVSEVEARDFALNPYNPKHSDKAMVMRTNFGTPQTDDAVVIGSFFAIGNVKLLAGLEGSPRTLARSGIK